MRSLSTPDVRWDVISSLQDSLQNLSPGSPAYDRMDAAINLALNPRREVKSVGFLRRNVLRDAKRIGNRRHLLVPFSALTPHDRRDLAKARADGDPQLIAEVRDVVSHIRSSVSRIEHGMDCVDAMLAEEPVWFTAQRLGVSRRRIEYVRSIIRANAFRILSA